MVCADVELTLPPLTSTDAVCLNLQSAPLSANARDVCIRQRWCREGKGMLLSSAAFLSSQEPVHVLHLGEAVVPFTSLLLSPMSVACNCCEQRMAEGSWCFCYKRKRLCTYPKAALSIICFFFQSGEVQYNLCQKTLWVWFWGFGFEAFLFSFPGQQVLIT